MVDADLASCRRSALTLPSFDAAAARRSRADCRNSCEDRLWSVSRCSIRFPSPHNAGEYGRFHKKSSNRRGVGVGHIEIALVVPRNPAPTLQSYRLPGVVGPVTFKKGDRLPRPAHREIRAPSVMRRGARFLPTPSTEAAVGVTAWMAGDRSDPLPSDDQMVRIYDTALRTFADGNAVARHLS
jgi:hypothetical protein